MPRKIRDAKLDSRSARAKLAVKHEPYWRAIDHGMHLGYRKGIRKSSWVARFRNSANKYHKTGLGLADDAQDADGASILSFSQAQEKAREWFNRMKRVEQGSGVSRSGGVYKVEDVMYDYFEWFKVHRKDPKLISYTINSLILPVLGHIDVEKLRVQDIREFHEKLSQTPARLRNRNGKKLNTKNAPKSEEDIRKRRATANRVLSTLRAALNRAFYEGHIASDDAWRRVKPFKNVDRPRKSYLNLDQCPKLVAVCEPEFGKLVQAALLTGCRYGELTRLKFEDYNPDNATLFIETSKSGQPRHVIINDEGKDFFEALCKGKENGDTLLTRPGGGKWGRSHQTRPLKEACEKAGIKPAISFHILRHTHASQLAMTGTPLIVIARQLGHSDTRMAERHYAHLSNSYIAKMIRDGMPRMGFAVPADDAD